MKTNDRQDNVRLIGHFVKEIASAVPVIDAIEACCTDALVDHQHMAVSCPNKAHSESSIKDLTHCYIKRANGGMTWTCFACSGSRGGSDGGDSVDYVARWHGIPQLRAAQMINQAMGLNIPDPIGGMRGDVRDYVYAHVNQQPPKAAKANTVIAQAKRQTAATIDRVYQAIAAACPPDDDLRRRLKADRGMTDAEIDRDIIGPIPHGIVDMLIERGITAEDMIGVPGFFQDPECGSVKFARQAVDYGIIVRGIGGRIVGLMAKYGDNGHKYGWFSSARYHMGVSSRAPAGYLRFLDLPGEWDDDIGDFDQSNTGLGKRAPIMVCEGYHKAATVRRTWGLRCIYVSGIQSTGGVGMMIDDITQEYGCYARVIVAPDTDCIDNPQVMAGTLRMIDRIVSTGMIEWLRIAMWDIDLGKGIDDAIRAAGPDAIHSVKLYQWIGYIEPYIRNYANQDLDWKKVQVILDQVKASMHMTH